MGWLAVLLGALATYGYYSEAHVAFAWLTGTLTATSLWSYGVMHNFAVEAAKHRPDYRGGFGDFTNRDLVAVPNWVTNVNLGSAVAILLLAVGAAMSWWL